MSSRRRSPSPFRSKNAAVTWFMLGLMILIVLGALFYQFIVNYDFESFTAGDQPIGNYVPEEGGYVASQYPPDPYAGGETPAPTALTMQQPTPVPIDRYAMMNKRMLMPDSYEKVYGGLTECRASEPDNNRVLVVRGWGYLESLNAGKSQVYLAVSSKYGNTHRFYLTTRESGSTAMIHDSSTGTNLDKADFYAAIKIEDTYQDGDYRLGIVVTNTENGIQLSGYTRLDADYNFNVDNGQITKFEG